MRRAVLVALVLFAGCGGDDERGDKRLIAALGDSITAGAPGWDPDPAVREQLGFADPDSQWERWAQEELGERFEFRNCGVSGERTDEIAMRLDECLEDADVVILQGGINDLVQGRSPREAAATMRQMVERGRADGRSVFVANALPVNIRDPRLPQGLTHKIRRLNALVQRLGAPVIDFFAILEDPAGSDRMRGEWTAEGLHPSVEGYRLLGEAVAAACSTNSSCSAR